MLKAILIDCIPLDADKDYAEFRMDEAESLISTYGGIVLVRALQRKMLPNYRTYVGTGKLDELVMDALSLGANILIINNELKPQQIYNVSEIVRKSTKNLQVWDRIDLILKIFQKHAQTKEAKLEIELASIRHMGPRIFGMGMELSRQGGGIGTKGIGETNTEIMRRHLKEQERKIREELEACKKTRKLQRESRKRQGLATVGIIGYTNAGKSSLLNALTKKGAYVADKLFATLDTRVGKIYLQESNKEILISDTIGFIQDLPHTLIESFQSTLEETIEADLLLHVIDIHDPKMHEKVEVVHEVLRELGVVDKPIMYVFNKIDLVKKNVIIKIKKEFKSFSPCFISTFNKEGLDTLKEVIGKNI